MNSPGELVKEKNMEVSTLLFLFTSYLQQNMSLIQKRKTNDIYPKKS